MNNPTTTPRTPTRHDLIHLDHSEAYDRTQWDDTIHDGDVLHLADGARAILVQAWPVMVVGDSDTFHHLAPGVTWEVLDGGKYMDAVRMAHEIVTLPLGKLVESTDPRVDPTKVKNFHTILRARARYMAGLAKRAEIMANDLVDTWEELGDPDGRTIGELEVMFQGILEHAQHSLRKIQVHK
jgi:hypothetical protein